MNRTVGLWLILLGCVFPWTVCAQAPDLKRLDVVLRSVPDGPVALVKGSPISAEEFRGIYRSELARVKSQRKNVRVSDAERIKLAVFCLRALVEREILYQEAQKRGLSVSDEAVNKAWEAELEILRRGLAKGKEDAPSEARLLDIAGTSREQALAEVRKTLLIEKARADIVKRQGVEISDEAIAEVFAEQKEMFARPELCHIKQIFVRKKASADGMSDGKAEARQKAEEALKRLYAGHRFAAVARTMSDPPFSEHEGDLGPLPLTGPDAMPEFLAEAAASLKPGEISDIIESEYGFHIIKLVEFTPGSEPSLDEARPLLRQMLLAQEAEEAVREFCEPILSDATAVQVFLELDRSFAEQFVFDSSSSE